MYQVRYKQKYVPRGPGVVQTENVPRYKLFKSVSRFLVQTKNLLLYENMVIGFMGPLTLGSTIAVGIWRQLTKTAAWTPLAAGLP
jgi:hypothetical protein